MFTRQEGAIKEMLLSCIMGSVETSVFELLLHSSSFLNLSFVSTQFIWKCNTKSEECHSERYDVSNIYNKVSRIKEIAQAEPFFLQV